MKYHLVTTALLLAAFALYSIGMRAGGMVLFVVGAAFELWFWVRVIRGAGKAPSAASSMSNVRPLE